MNTIVDKLEEAAETIDPPVCTDLDEDCAVLPHDHLRCWLYAPECGLCPFLPQT